MNAVTQAVREEKKGRRWLAQVDNCGDRGDRQQIK
jgi:hypothetical protein